MKRKGIRKKDAENVVESIKKNIEYSLSKLISGEGSKRHWYELASHIAAIGYYYCKGRISRKKKDDLTVYAGDALHELVDRRM